MFEGSNIFLSLILSAVSALIVIAEYSIKKHHAVFAVMNAIYIGAAALFMIYKESPMCDLLLLILITLTVRLLFEIREGRHDK